MNTVDTLYTGCPVQHARQFLAGKWQMGILWNLRNESLRFSTIKNRLPGLPDKTLMQELEFFINKGIVQRNVYEFPSPKIEYSLTEKGGSLIPVINAIVEWGYQYLQEERVNSEMSMTPHSAILAIESSMVEPQ